MTTMMSSDAAVQTWDMGNGFRVHREGEPFRLTLTGPAGEIAVLSSSSEIAMALNVSGRVLSWDLTDDEIAAAVMAGVRNAGVDYIRDLDQAARRYLARLVELGATAADPRGQHTVWGSVERERLCASLAHRLMPKPDLEPPARPKRERYAHAVVAGHEVPVAMDFRFGSKTAPDMYMTMQVPVSYEDVVVALCALVFSGDMTVEEFGDAEQTRSLALETLINVPPAVQLDDVRFDIEDAEPGSEDHVLIQRVRALVAEVFAPQG